MSDERSTQINLLSIFERVVKLEGSTSALHSRLDSNEERTERAVATIAKQQGEILSDLKEVIGWMNRGKGWAAAALLVAGVIGSAVTALIGAFFKTSGKT